MPEAEADSVLRERWVAQIGLGRAAEHHLPWRVDTAHQGITVANFLSQDVAHRIAQAHNLSLAIEVGIEEALAGGSFAGVVVLEREGVEDPALFDLQDTTSDYPDLSAGTVSEAVRRALRKSEGGAAEPTSSSSQDRAPRSAFGRLVRASRRALLRGGGVRG